jgi:hypothetical protein
MKNPLIKPLLLLLLLISFSNAYSQTPDGKTKFTLVEKKQKLKCTKCYRTCSSTIEALEDFDYSNSSNPELNKSYFNKEILPYLLAKVIEDNQRNKCKKEGCEESYSGNHIWELVDEEISKEKMSLP